MAVLPQLPLELVARYAPILHLHPDDRYMPCTPQWFLERCELRWCPAGADGAYSTIPPLKDTTVVLPVDRVSEGTLEEAMQQYGADSRNLLLHLPSEEHCKGQCQDNLDNIPIYAHVKLAVDDDEQPEAFEINYITFHAYNGAYSLFGMPCVQAGAHVGDWEHMTVRLDALSLALQGIWYNSHRNIEGEWRPAEEAPRHATTGRPVAYIARNGHGMYPQAGIIPRIFCAANDVTSTGGKVWDPRRVVLLCDGHDGYAWRKHRSRGCALPLAAALPERHTHTWQHAPASPGAPPASVASGAHGVGGVVGPGTPPAVMVFSERAGEAAEGPGTGADSSGPGVGRQGDERAEGCSAPAPGLPEVILDRTSVWQRFTGYWGTSEAPCMQCWFHGIEPPLSRGAFTRLCMPLARGVERLPAKSTKRQGKG